MNYLFVFKKQSVWLKKAFAFVLLLSVLLNSAAMPVAVYAQDEASGFSLESEEGDIVIETDLNNTPESNSDESISDVQLDVEGDSADDTTSTSSYIQFDILDVTIDDADTDPIGEVFQKVAEFFAPMVAVDNDKLKICHFLPGNEGNPQSLSITQQAWANDHDSGTGEHSLDFIADTQEELAIWYNGCEEPSANSITVVATKIVCESEEYLPNMADGGSFNTGFDADWAANWVEETNTENQSDVCWLESGWDFQWAPDETENPGDSLVGYAGDWTSFGLTDGNGETSASIEIPDGSERKIWVREVLKDEYIPFSFETTGTSTANSAQPGNNVTAEIYCNGIAGNYDNYDEVINWEIGDEPSDLEAGEIYYCVAFNAPVEEITPICDPQVNLVKNGSFENPEVTHGESWGVFASGFSGLEWLVEWVDVVIGQPVTANIEIQENGIYFGGTGAEGNQWAELDSDWYQPGVNGSSIEDASARILQDIPTNPEYTYTVSYKTSPRPEAQVADSKIDAKWDGVFKQQASAINNIFGWSDNSFSVVATNSTSTISFEDAGDGNNLGLFIDDISVYCTETPVDVCPNDDGIQTSTDQCTPVDQCNESDLTIVSDLNTTVDGNPSVTTGSVHWTANISGATWIWETAVIADPVGTTTKTFTRTFNLVDGVATATLDIATDNSYVVFLNGIQVGADSAENNHSLAGQDVITLDNSDFLYGTNTLEIIVTNWSQVNGVVQNNPAGLLYKLDLDLSSCIDLPGEEVPNQCTIQPFVVITDESFEVTNGATTTSAVAAWVHAGWALITGSKWISDTEYVVDPTATSTRTFTQEFYLNGDVSTSTLEIAADNSFVVKINGATTTVDTDENNFNPTQIFNLATSTFVNGTNTIEIIVDNFGLANATSTGNPTGVIAKLSFDVCDGGYIIPDEPNDPGDGGGDSDTGDIELVKSGVYNSETNEITFSIDWTITGNSEVENIVITDEVATATEIVQINDGGATTSTTTIEWDLGTQTNGATGTVSFVVSLDPVSDEAGAPQICSVANTANATGAISSEEVVVDGTSSTTVTVNESVCDSTPNDEPEDNGGGGGGGSSGGSQRSGGSSNNDDGQVLGADTFPGLPNTGNGNSAVVNIIMISTLIALAYASRKYLVVKKG